LLIDTHAHLDFPDFKGDLDAVLERALERGVARIVSVGFDLHSSQHAVALAHRYANVSAAVGVHPHDASSWNATVASELESLAKDARVVAIGETGLDYYRNNSPRDAQVAAFRAQLALADRVGLPVIVHDREAHEDTMTELRAWSSDASLGGKAALRGRLGVLHCFSGETAMAEELLAMGFLVSFAGPISYPKSIRLADLAMNLPLSSMVVETDSPFLPPQPWRGKRNEPAYVTAVAEKIAELRHVPYEVVAQATTANAKRLFGLS
jgi:TatD DNase family protein